MTDRAILLPEKAGGQTMKALSLWQPWASLVAEGIKCVETRGWATSYRGPLAIAASASIPTDVRHRVLGHWIRGRYNSYSQGDPQIQNALYEAGYEDGGVPDGKPLPLGCVVATCTLVDVVMTGTVLRHSVGGTSWNSGTAVHESTYHRSVAHHWSQTRTRGGGPWNYSRLIDHREWPFGDYTPGRYAWLLADIVKLDPPEPAKGKQGLWTWNRGGSMSTSGESRSTTREGPK